MKKLPVGELLRLACLYAEQDREAFLEAWQGVNDEGGKKVQQETASFLKQLKAYRRKRWGKSWRERLDEMPTKTIDVFTGKPAS